MSLPSRIGFGVSGAHGTPLVSRAHTVAIIQEAFALGVRVFDTAPAYGAGEAERRLGEALRTLERDQVFVSTKAGLSSYGLSGRRRDFSPDAIEQSLRASLDRFSLRVSMRSSCMARRPRSSLRRSLSAWTLLRRPAPFGDWALWGEGLNCPPLWRPAGLSS
jgi:predicted oxidoreductase